VSICFLIGIPVVALIIFFVRKATGIKEANRYVGYTLGLLWFVGLISTIVLAVSVFKDFRTGSIPVKEKFALVQPSGGKLVIKQAEDYTGIDEIEFFDYTLRVAEDTVIINTAGIKLEKSDTDSFEVYIERYSRGRRVSQARELAREIIYQVVQKDSILYVPSGISIPTNSKFRGQEVRVVVKVPANKHVVMDKSLNFHHNHWNFDDDYEWDEWGHYRERGQVEIKMNENGYPEDLNEQRENAPDSNSTPENKTDSLEKNYRYKGGKQENKTPADDSGSDKTPAAQHSQVALDGMSVIAYSFYKLIK
jgi:phage shock protein C